MAERRVPRIRFKGFEEDWEQRKLKELANRVIVGLATSVTPYYREQGVPILRNLNIKENHLDDSDLLYLDGMYADKQNSKKIRTGDVLTVHTGYIGTSCVVPPQYDNCLTFTTLVTTTNSLKILGDFLSQYLNSQFGMLAVQMVTTQGGRQNLNTNDFVQVEMSYPFIAEQKKICEILSTLDSLLSLHQRKLEKLKILKKAMLEKMFPKNGAKVPEIRFSGFTDDWEQRKLGEIGTVMMCRRVFKNQTSESGEIPFYKIGTFGGVADAFISKALFEEYRVKYPFPEKGDVLISASGSIGRTVEYTGEEAYFQDSNIVWLKHDESVINTFLRNAYEVVKWSGVEGSTIKRLYNDNILRTRIKIPTISEQEKIARFLDGFDMLLSLHQRKLEKLRQIKKSMLERIFV